MDSFEITLKNQHWLLLPEKAVYWKEQNVLILTDPHLGKSGHFRKSGIAAPAQINCSNLARLESLITKFSPGEIIILGDLFHSSLNREWLEFEEWRKRFRNISFVLIAGNHDQMDNSFYKSAAIEYHDMLVRGPFCLVHDSNNLKEVADQLLIVSGHVHPGVKLKGKGRQSLRLPCFYFSDANIILPAFGEFTGLHTIEPDETDRVFAIADGQVVQILPGGS